MSTERTKFKEWRGEQAMFDFVCEGCGAEGELGVPKEMRYKPFGCPAGCGATYIYWQPPTTEPALKCVVCPVFRDPR